MVAHARHRVVFYKDCGGQLSQSHLRALLICHLPSSIPDSQIAISRAGPFLISIPDDPDTH